MTINTDYDAIIIGSGMGGMSTAALLASDGYKVLILEAALHPGGCSSSYPRKGYIFESGATTLIGFDEHQPLRKLEEITGIHIPRQELNPSMTIWIEGERLTRYKDQQQWIEEAVRVFGNPKGQRKFWELAFRLAKVVWKVSNKNSFFPPQKITDWIRLFTTNNPGDAWVLRYAFKSVKEIAGHYKIDSPRFLRLLDEQLMITAQAVAADTPFLFGAAGITYTNYSNFYVPGGLIKMIDSITGYVESQAGTLKTKEAVTGLMQEGDSFVVHTKKKKWYKAPLVVSNIPVWNMPDITGGKFTSYFEQEASKYKFAWGAITMGIATSDTYPEESGIHHQIHLDDLTVPFTESKSVFVSMSQRGDTGRAPEGERTLNVSCHANPEVWFGMNEEEYEANKGLAQEFILKVLKKKLPGFSQAEIKIADTATPVSWENWVYRKKGRVGGIPQSMARSLLKWTPHETPFKGLYMVGDTTWPGQGIPGVTLSGINVYSRIKKNH